LSGRCSSLQAPVPTRVDLSLPCLAFCVEDLGPISILSERKGEVLNIGSANARTAIFRFPPYSSVLFRLALLSRVVRYCKKSFKTHKRLPPPPGSRFSELAIEVATRQSVAAFPPRLDGGPPAFPTICLPFDREPPRLEVRPHQISLLGLCNSWTHYFCGSHPAPLVGSSANRARLKS